MVEGDSRYELVEMIGAGGMAEVYRARMVGAVGFEKLVAIKRLLPHVNSDQEFVQRFVDEARLTARLVHPNICQILDFGVMDNCYFITMEYVDGLDLWAVLEGADKENEKIPVDIALYVISGVLRGLKHAHEATDDDGRPLGIVHRDVSPQNILLSVNGDVKLSDLGAARANEAYRSTRTQKHFRLGKVLYMAPEQRRHKTVDARADLYSSGILLTEMLLGQNEFHQDANRFLAGMCALWDKVSERLAAPFGQDLAHIIERSLQEDPERRYQTADEMLTALEALLVEYAPGTSVDRVARLVQRLKRRRKARKQDIINKLKSKYPVSQIVSLHTIDSQPNSENSEAELTDLQFPSSEPTRVRSADSSDFDEAVTTAAWPQQKPHNLPSNIVALDDFEPPTTKTRFDEPETFGLPLAPSKVKVTDDWEAPTTLNIDDESGDSEAPTTLNIDNESGDSEAPTTLNEEDELSDSEPPSTQTENDASDELEPPTIPVTIEPESVHEVKTSPSNLIPLDVHEVKTSPSNRIPPDVHELKTSPGRGDTPDSTGDEPSLESSRDFDSTPPQPQPTPLPETVKPEVETELKTAVEVPAQTRHSSAHSTSVVPDQKPAQNRRQLVTVILGIILVLIAGLTFGSFLADHMFPEESPEGALDSNPAPDMKTPPSSDLQPPPSPVRVPPSSAAVVPSPEIDAGHVQQEDTHKSTSKGLSRYEPRNEEHNSSKTSSLQKSSPKQPLESTPERPSRSSEREIVEGSSQEASSPEKSPAQRSEESDPEQGHPHDSSPEDLSQPPQPHEERGSEETPNPEKTLPSRSEESGYLNISSQPSGVPFVDGVPIASGTPVARYRVSPGIHRIVVRCPSSSRMAERTVRVSAGQTQNVTLALE